MAVYDRGRQRTGDTVWWQEACDKGERWTEEDWKLSGGSSLVEAVWWTAACDRTEDRERLKSEWWTQCDGWQRSKRRG